MVGVLEDVGRGLVNGHGSGTSGRVGHLTGVDGESGKLLLHFRHDRLLDLLKNLV